MKTQILSDIPVFLAVARSGSFSKAANDLSLTPSAVSKRIAQMEERLAVRLFNRTTRRINLSEEGSLLLDYAERIAEEAEEARQLVGDLTGKPAGTLHVAMPVSFGFAILNEAVTAFAAANPDVLIHAELDDRAVDIIENHFDVAIRVGRLEDSTYKARRLADCPMTLCASPAYLQAQGMPETPSDLKNHYLLSYQNHVRPKAWIYRNPRGQAGSVSIPCRFTSNNGDLLLQGALNGLGIVLLPGFLTQKYIDDGRLTALLKDYETLPERGVYAMYVPSPKTAPKIRAFIDFLVEWFEKR